MFIVTIKLPEKRTRLLAGGAILALLLILFALRLGGAAAVLSPADPDVSLCRNCLHGFGWQVEAQPVEQASFVLTQELSGDYLALQREAGFDLSPHAGKTIRRYTFAVTNYPTGETGVLADVLILDGQVIGGDIRTSDMDGFMHSLVYPG